MISRRAEPLTPVPQPHTEPELDEDYAAFAGWQEVIERPEAVMRVRKILVRSRGRELPGTFNPVLISQLFWEQSENWKPIAEHHIEKVAGVCSAFATAALNFSASPEVSYGLQSLRVDKALGERLTNAKAELLCIIADMKHHPITYNPAYTAMMQKTRYEKHSSKFKTLVHQAEIDVVNAYNKHQTDHYLKPDVMRNGMDTLLEPDMDKTSAEDALDSQQAYYKVGCRGR